MNAFFAVILCTVVAYICRNLKFSPIPIYIILGTLLGHLGILKYKEGEMLSELGLVFLLFYIGLKIRPKDIKTNIGKISLSGLFDFIFNFFPPLFLLLVLGFDTFTSFILASAIYVSSSAICLKLLIESRKLIFPFAETVVWLMIFEDIIMIAILTLVSASGTLPLIKILGLFGVIYILYRFAHKLSVLFNRDDEIPFLAAFSFPSLALLASKKLGISEALTAITLGIPLSRFKLDSIVLPFKEVFLAIFFVFFGVSVSFTNIDLPLVVALTLIAMVGKFIGGYIIGLKIHRSRRDGVRIFKHTIPRGELSVILTSLYIPQFSGIISIIVLITSIIGTILSRK